jgi:phenylacetate-CoA ligase
VKTALSRKNLWDRLHPGLKTPLGRLARLLPLRCVLGRSFRRTERLASEAQWWPAERARAYQLQELQRICRLAYEKAGFYRKAFESVGFHPKDLKSIEDLRALPLTDRQTIRENLSEMCTRSKTDPSVDFGSTSGTSGEPLYFYMGRERTAVQYAYLIVSWARAGYRLGMPMAVLRGRVVRPRRHDCYYEHDPLLGHFYYSSFHMTDQNMEAYLDHISRIGPCFLHVYPSTAAALARFLRRRDAEAPPGIRGLIAESEIVYPEQRSMVEEVLGCRYFSCYGQSEKVVLAAECEQSIAYHVWPTYSYFELLDDAGRPVSTPGQRGEIVGTSFVNTVVPFVRYRTGDHATYVSDRCKACGREHILIRDVSGHRNQEMLIGFDGQEIPWVALNMHDDTFVRVQRFQFYQDTPGSAVLRIVPAREFGEADRRRILANLDQKLDNQLSLEIELVSSLRASPRGKAIYVDQQIKQFKESKSS